MLSELDPLFVVEVENALARLAALVVVHPLRDKAVSPSHGAP
jgi:hypothetical protein